MPIKVAHALKAEAQPPTPPACGVNRLALHEANPDYGDRECGCSGRRYRSSNLRWAFGLFKWIAPLISALLLAIYGAILAAGASSRRCFTTADAKPAVDGVRRNAAPPVTRRAM